MFQIHLDGFSQQMYHDNILTFWKQTSFFLQDVVNNYYDSHWVHKTSLPGRSPVYLWDPAQYGSLGTVEVFRELNITSQ